MDAVKKLIENYDVLVDPVTDESVGAFSETVQGDDFSNYTRSF